MKAIRDEQLRQRREAAACSVEREKAHWERGREQWVRENRREEEEGEGRRKVGGWARGHSGAEGFGKPISYLRNIIC